MCIYVRELGVWVGIYVCVRCVDGEECRYNDTLYVLWDYVCVCKREPRKNWPGASPFEQ